MQSIITIQDGTDEEQLHLGKGDSATVTINGEEISIECEGYTHEPDDSVPSLPKKL